MNQIGDPYENLANAIVIQAAADYKRTLRTIRRDPISASAKERANHIERFFHSEWYRHLTKVDGKLLVKKLKEAVI